MAIQYLEPLDRTFHALGNATRRQILMKLSREGATTAGQLVELFNSSQPTISKHLGVMDRAGLVRRSVEGRNHVFSLSPNELVAAQTWIDRHLLMWNESFDRLDDYLSSEDKR